MYEPLYLQQEEHLCKILYICNKRGTHVELFISATRGHSCKILYICNKRSTPVRSSIYSTHFWALNSLQIRNFVMFLLSFAVFLLLSIISRNTTSVSISLDPDQD